MQLLLAKGEEKHAMTSGQRGIKECNEYWLRGKKGVQLLLAKGQEKHAMTSGQRGIKELECILAKGEEMRAITIG